MSQQKTLKVVQAYDGQEIETIELQDWQQADQMLRRASELYNNRELWLAAYKRAKVLNQLAALMHQAQDELALLIAREGGKPLTDARVEVKRAINGVELAKAHIAQMVGEQIPMDLSAAGVGRLAMTTKEPIGVVLALSAFNHPLNLIVHQVVPAIATGCPVIVKPAANTPLSCLRFVEMVKQTDLPAHWVQACVCDRDTTNRLVADPRIAFLSFIGSAKVGWQLRRQIADGTRCALEHGGVAPVIVAADADLEKTVPALVKAAYYHAGQVCVSVQRIFVANVLKEAFLEKFIALVASLKVGDPRLLETDVGPLIKPAEVTRVQQ
ncbi:MAG: aldehyde dehydrogenase family protein, partial [Thiohalomonadales bacterium]